MGLLGKKSGKESAVSSRQASGGNMKRSMSRNESAGTSVSQLNKKLDELKKKGRELAEANAAIAAKQKELPANVQMSQKLDAELLELGKKYQTIVDEAKELEIERRRINDSIHSDANAASLQNFKVTDEKLQRDKERLQEEFDSLAHTALLNRELIDALKWQVQKHGLIVPVAEVRDAEKPYEHAEIPLPEPKFEDLFDEVPAYVKQREADKKELEEKKAAAALKAGAVAANGTNAAPTDAAPVVPPQQASQQSDSSGGGVRNAAAMFSGGANNGNMTWMKPSDKSHASEDTVRRNDSGQAWVSGATKKASKWEVKTTGLSKPMR